MSKYYGFVVAVGLIAAFVPLPAIVLEALLGVELVYAIWIFIYSFKTEPFKMPLLCTLFIAISFVLNIGFTQAGLRGLRSGMRIPVIEMCAAFIGKDCYITGFFAEIIVFVLLDWIMVKVSTRLREVNAYFHLGIKTKKQANLDNEIAQGNITLGEIEQRKEELLKEESYYRSMEKVFPLFNAGLIMGVFLAAVSVLGCLLIMKLSLNAEDSVALETAMVITTGNLFAFIVPQSLVLVSLCVSVG